MLKMDMSEMIGLAGRLKHDARLIQRAMQDQQFIDHIRDIVKQNFRDVWASKGAAIDQDWAGRTLVQTGNLRNSLTTDRIEMRVINGVLTFESRVTYSKFVNDMYTYYGLTDKAQRQIQGESIGWLLKNQGRLRWDTR